MTAMVSRLLTQIASACRRRAEEQPVAAGMTTEELRAAIAARDEAIVILLSLFDNLQQSIGAFAKMAARKIRGGQILELLDNVEAGNVSRDNMKVFLAAFDAVVELMFPDFYGELNRLLRPEHRLQGDARAMTTEQRIVALMRLGITDSKQIARLLGVSRNTVYTYRNHMRSLAIDRETFEQAVEAMASID